MPDTATGEAPLDIAIVGGGIVGVVLAVGLIRQKIKVMVYEQAQGFREIGAGMAFTANARQCMDLIDPTITVALRASGSVATSSGDEQDPDPNDYLRWIDGHNQHRKVDPSYQKMLFKIDAGYKGFEGCRRDRFLEELVKILPADVIQCRKRLDTLEEKEDGGKIRLIFCDGTTAEADAVIGCDGIKSRVREIILGEGNPASYAHYTHKIAYRGLIPMAKAIEVLGEYKARNQHIHVGPNAHLIHYPVANQTMINATAFVSDPEEWPDDKRTVAPATRKDVEDAFEGWSPCVRGLVSQLPEKLDKWAVFDLWDYPAPFYNRGKICLAGDAAHASSPHHGAGACMGIEDVLCLCTLMGEARVLIQKAPTIRDQALISVFETFNSVRRTRSQWLVNSSRRVCDLYHQPEWADPAKWVKAETCFEEIKDRSHKIWHFNYNVMLQEATQGYKQSLKALIGAVSGL
ncbi:hypothetical protein D8B26_006744 [Coccidioides posadasii str. Silveira]|uniref:Uncharacterized protein n=3 Tax=Coccidioides posadasii TaxID=199306 RepID=E9CRG5_COCPS|nr:salicylate 1-monooxygenase, putative [Coccidioides posadasii C735 delta SOWgp]EER28083.1 salicylate 1-monooxygenase, putative [Coccidioides posadasii C735 delta SOWgp]EFW23243.1 conserved hypothetical protein [Coccidioides posadasii str. Silveira]KMM68114.1 salicylate 1-monooxygenase [Coccidioides posadasii RMSCC 3488]QVM12108.1 hypothetical protein D8B26_006744 [Coccidioides posadasii str. Silveira]|eukprot:XP_003070228.1 salicylate 1-monooxygenase, putative [Coccidioides posadasii C735 delta SOWgp]